MLLKFVSAFLFLLLASLTDIKQRIVPNKLVFAAFFLGFILNINDLNSWFFSVISAAVICTILYFLGAFAFGDVKLFVAFASILPNNITYLSNILGINATTFNNNLFFLQVLIVASLLVFPLTIFLVFYRLIKRKKKDKIKEFNNYLAFDFVIAYLLSFSLNVSNVAINLLTYLSILTLIISKGKTKIILSYTYILFTSIAAFYFTGFSFVKELPKIYLLLAAITTIFFTLKNRKELMNEKTIEELEEGDIINLLIAKKGKEIIVKEISLLEHIALLFEKNIEVLFSPYDANGLEEEHINLLKKLQKDGKIGKKVYVKDTLPFVPLIFLAFLILDAFGDVVWQNVLTFIKNS